ncbi:MAG TPA: universal stress protein, partial [Geminicoccaceae bacterium]|nr:universal stress protein [Geminicoccaceae bacterium]
DLTILAQPEAGGLVDAALEPKPIHHVVLSAGGPVLMLPRAEAGQRQLQRLGHRALVAWNGSREAARALKDALPFLAAAGEQVAVRLDAAAALLKRHGAPVTAKQIPPGAGDAGATLLGAADAEGADLLVMGAYGHSRLRELVLGGATREVLRDARVPVLLSA